MIRPEINEKTFPTQMFIDGDFAESSPKKAGRFSSLTKPMKRSIQRRPETQKKEEVAERVKNSFERARTPFSRSSSLEPKIAQIELDYTVFPEEKKNLNLNGRLYPVDFIGHGEFHSVYRIASKFDETHGTKQIPEGNHVLRTLYPLLDPRKKKITYNNDFKAFEHCDKESIPTPNVYLNPLEVVDTQNSKNGFWLLEFVPHKVDFDEGFSFAKTWLTKSANENREIIGDFYLRNLGKRENGEIVVLDPTLPDDPENFTMNLVSFCFHWSKEGDVALLNELISDFPESQKETLREAVLAKRK